MRTRISSDNPYGCSRWGFAWEHVPAASAAHLDYGCYDGAFLSSLRSKHIRRLAGVDVNAQAIEQASRRFHNIEFIKIAQDAALPFENGTFTSITVLDVLEHVHDQHKLLAELNRILTADSMLIITVPGQHLFSFMDMGNLKFRLPRLHRWFFCLSHSQQQYQQRYVNNPDGLVGDISAQKRWHEHFSRQKLRTLLSQAAFEVTTFDGAGFFTRPISNLMYSVRWIKPLHNALARLINLDAKALDSANLFCLARKSRS
jgi:ubiquinone/menaquinone biosynthesis C-methylase UbiE